MKRCDWKGLENSKLYQDYHDNEWGIACHDDHKLFEMILLESFHCGLSWLIILKKRENFRNAFDNFDPNIIKNYDETKIEELLNDKGIIRNRQKIVANIANAKAFLKIQQEFDSFDNYIWSFTNREIIYGSCEENILNHITTNELSDKVTKDMKKRGFKFMGSVTTYSWLEAIGIMNNHSKNCFRYLK